MAASRLLTPPGSSFLFERSRLINGENIKIGLPAGDPQIQAVRPRNCGFQISVTACTHPSSTFTKPRVGQPLRFPSPDPKIKTHVLQALSTPASLSRQDVQADSDSEGGNVHGAQSGLRGAVRRKQRYDLMTEDSDTEALDSDDLQYKHELRIATQAVQLACQLTRRVQEGLLGNSVTAETKTDKSLVTIADWGVQAVVSWVLAQAFPGEVISMVAEEDTEALKGRGTGDLLQRVTQVVNECLAEGEIVGIAPPSTPLRAVDVLKAIQRGTSEGGPVGRHWILDPVDGTLGFVRGDQYAIALAMMEEGRVVLGVLGVPNFPMRTEWLRYPHKYSRMVEKLIAPPPDLWHRGCLIRARRGGNGAWMEPLMGDHIGNPDVLKALTRRVKVSDVTDPADATFCEPVEKGNTAQGFSASLADRIGLKTAPLRVYSMAKYAAIARGDAEVFMKFAKSTYREKIWDHAAGVIIVEEAGGVVTDAGGMPLDFSKGRYLDGLDRGIVACNKPSLHSTLLDAIAASWDSSLL